MDLSYLFKGGSSQNIKSDSLGTSLNSSQSLTRVSKSSKLAVWPVWTIRSNTALSFGLFTFFPVKGVIPICSQALTFKCRLFYHNKHNCRYYT